jgi:arylsulfatase
VQKGDIGGFSGSVFTDTGGAVVFNLYTNPRPRPQYSGWAA